jgi:murein DD-endopeptidase MepM/ murein hydrolase activator NlpD
LEGRIIEGFGPGRNGTHNDGINIAARAGARVVAAAAGTVVYVGNQVRGYGNLVLLKHDGGFLTAYAHNSMLLVHKGERVARGQTIARVGATGGVGEPQLHFEIRSGTKPIDPSRLLPPLEEASAE